MGEMREILFRGQVKDKDELIGKGFTVGGTMNPISEWVYGVPIPRYPDLFLAWSEGNGEYEEITVIPETIGQYVGLDKNGTRIFEGDICWFYGGDYYSGLWEQNAIVAITDMTDDEQTHYLKNAEYCEVIGNIYDNPELLEGKGWRK